MNRNRAPQFIEEANVFWGEIAPTEHIAHLYSDDTAFINMVEGFVRSGLQAGEAVIVIATDTHLSHLNARLGGSGIDLSGANFSGQYTALNADACLSQFMVNGWPDPQKFEALIKRLLAHAMKNGRVVRAFGEMVALLWAQGHNGATVQLEHLWNQVRRATPFPLFCSYPISGFTQATTESFQEICSAHTKIIARGSMALAG